MLGQARAIIKQHKGPWLVGGDFNMTPGELRRDGGWWLNKVGGEIAAAGVATHRPSEGEHREHDYFDIDK